jgi:hypothetical protein
MALDFQIPDRLRPAPIDGRIEPSCCRSAAGRTIWRLLDTVGRYRLNDGASRRRIPAHSYFVPGQDDKRCHFDHAQSRWRYWESVGDGRS